MHYEFLICFHGENAAIRIVASRLSDIFFPAQREASRRWPGSELKMWCLGRLTAARSSYSSASSAVVARSVIQAVRLMPLRLACASILLTKATGIFMTTTCLPVGSAWPSVALASSGAAPMKLSAAKSTAGFGLRRVFGFD